MLTVNDVLASQSRTLIIKVKPDGTVDYDFTKDMTPELLSQLFVRISVMVDASQWVAKLAKHGYVDSVYRMQLASNNALQFMAGDAEPSEKAAPIAVAEAKASEAAQNAPVEAQATTSDEDRPMIEPLTSG